MDAQQPGHPLAGTNPLRLGARISLRYRLPEGSPASLTDVVGVVEALDEGSVTIRSRRGLVRVSRGDFVAARAVPPAPVRRARPHRAISVADLQVLAADGWPAVEQAVLGSWRLRASSGFTHRANSVLPIGNSSLPADAAVDFCEHWYAGRGLPARFQVPAPGHADALMTSLEATLLARGYLADRPSRAMTVAAGQVAAPGEPSPSVTMDAALSLGWLQAYASQHEIVAGVTEQVLTGSQGQLFFSSQDDDGTVRAVLRMSVHPGWAGLHALWVDPARRRHGLGGALVQSVATVATQHGMPSLYLQVADANAGAIALTESLGFTTHHGYRYLVQPG